MHEGRKIEFGCINQFGGIIVDLILLLNKAIVTYVNSAKVNYDNSDISYFDKSEL